MRNSKITFCASLIGLFLVFAACCYYDEVLPEDLKISDDQQISFANDIIPIFNQSCNFAGCHNSPSQPPDLLPANAYNSLNNGGYINIASPENSELYQWMKGNRGTPMPVEGANAAYNAKVLTWIRQGALNN